MQIDIEEILQYLISKNIVSQIIEVFSDETVNRGYYKILCKLIPSDYKLQIKWINTPENFIYSYQLFSNTHLLRWDNSPHFPDISTFPHHFHDINEKIKHSIVSGKDIKTDLDIIFKKIIAFIDNELTK
ncbi:MAG: hypothetical protein JEY97_06510 [Bacteroidales bacterium]|nr:hypothetical protein [Bacteroidales bacterium]